MTVYGWFVLGVLVLCAALALGSLGEARPVERFVDWLLGAHCQHGCGERVFPKDLDLHARRCPGG